MAGDASPGVTDLESLTRSLHEKLLYLLLSTHCTQSVAKRTCGKRALLPSLQWKRELNRWLASQQGAE